MSAAPRTHAHAKGYPPPSLGAPNGACCRSSAVLERQVPLTAPVGVHDVSFETPVAVADEGDPPPVRRPGRAGVHRRVPCEVPLSAPSAFMTLISLSPPFLRAPESDLLPIRRPGRFDVIGRVVRQPAGSAPIRVHDVDLVVAPPRPNRSAPVFNPGRRRSAARRATRRRSTVCTGASALAPIGADEVAPEVDRPPVR